MEEPLDGHYDSHKREDVEDKSIFLDKSYPLSLSPKQLMPNVLILNACDLIDPIALWLEEFYKGESQPWHHFISLDHDHKPSQNSISDSIGHPYFLRS